MSRLETINAQLLLNLPAVLETTVTGISEAGGHRTTGGEVGHLSEPTDNEGVFHDLPTHPLTTIPHTVNLNEVSHGKGTDGLVVGENQALLTGTIVPLGEDVFKELVNGGAVHDKEARGKGGVGVTDANVERLHVSKSDEVFIKVQPFLHLSWPH
jgi:hypothetical protein